MNCGDVCSASYPYGTLVTFTCTAAGGSTCGGWTGADCPGLDTCTVTVTGDLDLGVIAISTHTLLVSVNGPGAVSSDDDRISCAAAAPLASCEAMYPDGAPVKLTAVAAPGASFTGWTGPCSVNPCDLTMDADKNVTANFAASPFTVSGLHRLVHRPDLHARRERERHRDVQPAAATPTNPLQNWGTAGLRVARRPKAGATVTPTISGTAEPGSTVTVTIDFVPVGIARLSVRMR